MVWVKFFLPKSRQALFFVARVGSASSGFGKFFLKISKKFIESGQKNTQVKDKSASCLLRVKSILGSGPTSTSDYYYPDYGSITLIELIILMKKEMKKKILLT